VQGEAESAPTPRLPGLSPSLGVVLGAVAISFAPVFVEAIEPADLGPTGIALGRTAIGAVLLAVLACWRGETLRPTPRGAALALLAGALFAGDLWVWHRSIRLVGGGMATILGNTQVFWVALAGVAFLGERAGRRLLWAIPLALGGIALLTGVLAGEDAPRADPTGVALGLATGLFYATYILVIRRAQREEGRLGPVGHMVWVSLGCAVTSAVLAALDGTRVLPERAGTWAALAGVAILGQGAGWVTLATFLPRIPAARASLLLLLQPVGAVLWAALLFQRVLTPLQGVGAALALLAIYVGSTAGYPRRSPRPGPPAVGPAP